MGKFNGLLQFGAGEIEFTLLFVSLAKDEMRPLVRGIQFLSIAELLNGAVILTRQI